MARGSLARGAVVWLVTETDSEDVPRGVLGVYASKRLAMAVAQNEVAQHRLAGGDRLTRDSARWNCGVTVWWGCYGSSPWSIAVEPWRVES